MGNFLKDFDPALAKEYFLELFREGVFGDSQPEPIAPEPKKEIVQARSDGLVSVTALPDNSSVVKYLVNRGIPRDQFGLFKVAPAFNAWASKIDRAFSSRVDRKDVPRLVMEYRSRIGDVIGYACRAFGKEQPKYIILRLDKNVGSEFTYGIERVDFDSPIIAVEGQIDSLFLENCVAVGSANYCSDFVLGNKDKMIIVPDNDFRRNSAVCNQLGRAIEAGCSISFLPDYYPKDINDIIKSGVATATELRGMILSTKKSGLEAKLQLTLEKRC